MKSIFITFLVLSTSVFAAEGPCANKAKYEAIRSYKAEMGTVQGSEGIGYTAELLTHNKNIFDYVVMISDNNEDGEYWEVEYKVRVQEKNGSCKTLSVKKLGSVH